MNIAPQWWGWEIELTPHVQKRMVDRGFSETELRTMLQDATQWIEQSHGTWIVASKLDSEPWEIIIRPDKAERCIIVVTCYPIS